MNTLICRTCGVEKPRTEYYRTRLVCKQCSNKEISEHWKKNKEARKAICQRYYQKHKEECKQRCAEYRASPEVKENRRVNAVEYRKENSQERADYLRKWYKENPEQMRANSIKSMHIRRARIKQVPYESFYRQEIFDRDGGMCRYCGVTLTPNDWHLDHIVPIARGGAHTRENTTASCEACNLSKHDHLLEELGWTLKEFIQ